MAALFMGGGASGTDQLQEPEEAPDPGSVLLPGPLPHCSRPPPEEAAELAAQRPRSHTRWTSTMKTTGVLVLVPLLMASTQVLTAGEGPGVRDLEPLLFGEGWFDLCRFDLWSSGFSTVHAVTSARGGGHVTAKVYQPDVRRR